MSLVFALALIVAVAVFAESVWLLLRRREQTRWLELSADLFIFFVGEGIRLAMRAPFLLVYVALAALVPWRLEVTWWSAALCFVLVDGLLYGWHRLLHVTRLGWAFHSVHHTGREFALPLAGRLPWPLRFVDDLVPAPLVLLGFEPALIALCLAASFVVQALAHAAAVKTLGPLDAVLNTPANHRVHHHLDGGGQSKNFGAALMLWDRLFGTFERGDGVPRPIGVEALGDVGANPLTIQLAGLRQ